MGKHYSQELTMPTIFSYCVKCDLGLAPNPFWGVCTLAICKPAIRRTAKQGDWIVGTGTRNSLLGDLSRNVIYIMEVTNKMTMQKYDDYTIKYLPEKIPDNANQQRKVGDSIYDYSSGTAILRKSIHDEQDMPHDLSGIYVLLSEHFWYYGNTAIPLPDYLHGIVNNRPGHRSRSNDQYISKFLDWVKTLGEPNKLYGKPIIAMTGVSLLPLKK